jgi:hypothetical protein
MRPFLERARGEGMASAFNRCAISRQPGAPQVKVEDSADGDRLGFLDLEAAPLSEVLGQERAG